MSETKIKLDLALARREGLFMRLQNTFDLAKEVVKDQKNLGAFKVRCSRLEEAPKEYEAILQETLRLNLTLNPAYNRSQILQQLNTFEEMHIRTFAILERFKSPPAQEESEKSNFSVGVKLPEIRHFNGSQADWPGFFENF